MWPDFHACSKAHKQSAVTWFKRFALPQKHMEAGLHDLIFTLVQIQINCGQLLDHDFCTYSKSYKNVMFHAEWFQNYQTRHMCICTKIIQISLVGLQTLHMSENFWPKWSGWLETKMQCCTLSLSQQLQGSLLTAEGNELQMQIHEKKTKNSNMPLLNLTHYCYKFVKHNNKAFSVSFSGDSVISVHLYLMSHEVKKHRKPYQQEWGGETKGP